MVSFRYNYIQIKTAVDLLKKDNKYSPDTICQQFIRYLVDPIGTMEEAEIEHKFEEIYESDQAISQMLRTKYFDEYWYDFNIYKLILEYRFSLKLYELGGLYEKPNVLSMYVIVRALIAEIIHNTYDEGLLLEAVIADSLEHIKSFIGISHENLIEDIVKIGSSNYIDYLENKQVEGIQTYVLSRVVTDLMFTRIKYPRANLISYAMWLCKDNGVMSLHSEYLSSLLDDDGEVNENHGLQTYTEQLMIEYYSLTDDPVSIKHTINRYKPENKTDNILDKVYIDNRKYNILTTEQLNNLNLHENYNLNMVMYIYSKQ